VSSFSIQLMGINLPLGHFLDVITIEQSVKLSGQFSDTRMELQKASCWVTTPDDGTY
jgi:hypothetical protein